MRKLRDANCVTNHGFNKPWQWYSSKREWAHRLWQLMRTREIFPNLNQELHTSKVRTSVNVYRHCSYLMLNWDIHDSRNVYDHSSAHISLHRFTWASTPCISILGQTNRYFISNVCTYIVHSTSFTQEMHACNLNDVSCMCKKDQINRQMVQTSSIYNGSYISIGKSNDSYFGRFGT